MTPHLERLNRRPGHRRGQGKALQAAPQDAPDIRKAVARLERMEAELDRIEAGIAVRRGSARNRR